ncbi:SDR family oxidoreductase [Kitasatospora sp. NPDC017646]|uniref:SDR family oxidoreductase n=1 Tax=Kitasatospora sp. NPDC017646 TaxID=3364024 RepID=UPI0037937FDF
MTNDPVLVTGGTGTLGRQVVPLLRAAALPVRVLSRRERDGVTADGVTHVRGDLLGDAAEAAARLDEALAGVDTVLHLAGGPKGDDEATRRLVAAARRAGPTVYAMDELVRAYLAARGRSRRRLPVRVPGKVGRAYRAGANLNLAGAEHGRRTWEEFLAERLAA